MAPVFDFLRPTNFYIPRVILEKALDLNLNLQKLVGRAFGRKPGKLLKKGPKFVFENEVKLRKQLKYCPWWRLGHLELGFLELELSGTLLDKPSAVRALATAKISAEAVKKLLGPAHLISRGKKFNMLLKARVLEGQALSRDQKFDQSLSVLKNVLALNNASLLPPTLLYQALESAANAAYIVGNGQLATEYFNRVPVDRRSREGILMADVLSVEQVQVGEDGPPTSRLASD